MTPPALFIDGEVRAEGRVPDVNEIEAMLMKEKTRTGQSCSCGAEKPRRIIFPCAGQANVGQLTNLAAIQLTEEGYGNIACVALLAIRDETLLANVAKADEVVILDGCPMLCAKKIAGAQGIPASRHIVVTGLGIPKGPSKSYTQEDVGKIVAACRNDEGKKDIGPAGNTPGGKDGGCRCGSAGRN